MSEKRIVRGIVCAVLLGASLTIPAIAQQSDDVISEGVYIGDQNVGGMTKAEATSCIKQMVEELSSSVIMLQMGDAMVSTTWGNLGLTWENTDLVNEIGQIGTTGNIIRRYKEQKDLQNESSHFGLEYTMDEAAEKIFVDSLSAYNSEPVEGECYMGNDGFLQVAGGTDGYTLNEEATLAALQEYLASYQPGDQVIEAVYEKESPYLTADLLSQMTDVLGTATTDYSASSWQRAQNVENGTSKISGTLLLPGEGFSVTAAVTPFTADNGYELAPSYEAGQVVDSYGGGICQVSTTLYNAVLKSELEVDQRSNHTMIVTYVDPSKDAAIAEGVMDFVFTNDKEYPIYIYGSAYGGVLNFTIYGIETRPSNRTLEFVSQTISETNPDTNVTLVAKTDQPVGYFAQTSSAHQGLSAVLWKNIYVDGVLQDTIQVNSSNYTASPAYYEVGVATSNPALSSAIYTAIGSNSVSQVQQVIANAAAYAAPAPQQQQQDQQQQQQQQQQQAMVEQNNVVDADESIYIAQ